MSDPSSANDAPASWSNLDAAVDAFESRWSRDGEALIEDFLPSPDHAEFGLIAAELLCVDLERRWKRGQQKTVEDYRRQFPELLQQNLVLERLAFEEYRMLLSSGSDVCLSEYAQRLQIDTKAWPRRDASCSASVAREAFQGSIADQMQRISGVTCELPDVGDQFFNFEIVKHLGKCKFGCVYLASQNDLANRLVVLKVTTNLWSESERLARLQHTNVVPIYSVHQRDGLQAVCMPYLGRLTMEDLLSIIGDYPDRSKLTGADVVNSLAASVSVNSDIESALGMSIEFVRYLNNLTFEQACVWMMARIADGLAHAHQRGILHRDLKPANILVNDTGQPMILDFNLSEDAVVGGRSSLLIGGTLPYMAPEHLRAAIAEGRVDVRSDIYSLGVMLFQMLTGRLPIPVQEGSIIGNLSALIQERGNTPSVREFNATLTSDIDSIVQKCIAPNPISRYQTARELIEDLEAHLQQKSLRHAPNRSVKERVQKWTRRHPVVASNGTLAVVFFLVLATFVGLLGWRNHRIAILEAQELLGRFDEVAQLACTELTLPGTDEAEFQRGMERADAAFTLYAQEANHRSQQTEFQLLTAEQQRNLTRSVRQLHFLQSEAIFRHALRQKDGQRAERLEFALTHNGGASDPLNASRASLLQRRNILKSLGRETEAVVCEQRAANVGTEDSLARYMLAVYFVRNREYSKATPILEELQLEDPRNFFVWFLSGECFYVQSRYADAEACFSAAIVLWPSLDKTFFHRGLSRMSAGRLTAAAEDFSQAIRLRPNHAVAYADRALIRYRRKQYAMAVDDANRSIEFGNGDPTVFLIRGKARLQLGETAMAAADRAEALQREPTHLDSWIQRGLAFLPDQPEKALADFDMAIDRHEKSRKALQNRAYVLSHYLNRDEEAIASLTELLDHFPNDATALLGRGMLLAKQGNREAAIEDCRAALALDSSPDRCFFAARIFSQSSREVDSDASEAMILLRKAVRGKVDYARMAEQDPLFSSLVQRSDFRQLLGAAAALEH